ncbi:MAG TPA: diphosphomevalonate decarboxylase [Oscillatoriaceae cyanobacterium]
MRATARAHANIALVKYWGKRDEALHLPMNGSLSLTLDALYTTTKVTFEPALSEDRFVLDGQPAREADRAKVSAFLDRVRALANTRVRATVESANHVPTAAGLASSASAFAALAAASTRALGLSLDDEALSRLARVGSGSACRSIYGGFAEWRRGARADGLDSFAVPLASAEHWDLRMVVAVLEAGPKAVSSREGMRRTVASSVFYPGWLAGVEADLADARAAIAARDLDALGRVAEANALKMHATTLGATPPFTYWRGQTLVLLQAVAELRARGVGAYATIDAGPNVKVLCAPADLPTVQAALAAVSGVERLIVCAPGPGVTLLEDA